MLNNGERHKAKVSEIMSLEKIQREKKKKPGSFLKAFVLNLAHLNKSSLSTCLILETISVSLKYPVPQPKTGSPKLSRVPQEIGF